MDAIDGAANAVNGIPFFCCSLTFTTDYKFKIFLGSLANQRSGWFNCGSRLTTIRFRSSIPN